MNTDNGEARTVLGGNVTRQTERQTDRPAITSKGEQKTDRRASDG